MSVLQKLKLTNFRNIAKAEIGFVENNFIIGNNGQGKTNILEAIYSLSIGGSFRGYKDEWVIKSGELHSKIEGEFLIEGNLLNVELFWQRDGDNIDKTIRINKITAKKKDLLNKSFMVLFSPDLVYLIKTSATHRRKFLDELLSKVSRTYYEDLGSYNQALRQRNTLLKLRRFSNKDLEVWDQKLIEFGTKINQARQEVIKEIGERAAIWFKDLAPKDSQTLGLRYTGNITNKEEYKKKLASIEHKDRQFGYTNFGPHREDLQISLGGYLASQLASQGEYRLVVLALKLAEGEYGKEVLKKPGIYLLDDVFSELDSKRGQAVIKSFSNGDQVVYTTVDENIIKPDLTGKVRVDNGKVFQLSNELAKT